MTHCLRHQTWLWSRRPRVLGESYLNGWLGVWRSRKAWARAFDQEHDPMLGNSALGFVPATFDQPLGPWAEFHAAWVQALGRDCDPRASPFSSESIVARMLRDELAVLRHTAGKALQLQQPASRLGEHDFKAAVCPHACIVAVHCCTNLPVSQS